MKKEIFLIVILMISQFICAYEFSDVFKKIDSITLDESKVAIAGVYRTAFDSKGNIYIADSRRGQIFVFDKKGKYIRTVGKYGNGPGEFILLAGDNFDIDTRDNLYAYGKYNNKISVFGKNSEFIKDVRFKPHVDKLRFNSSDELFTGFVSLMKKNYLYKLDRELNITKSFCKTPDKVFKIREITYSYFGIDFDNSDNIYTIHELEYKIKKFDKDGNFLGSFGSPGEKFKRMKGLPPKGFTNSRKAFKEYSKTISQPYALFILEDKFVLIVSYHTENDNRVFLLDLYDIYGNKISDDIIIRNRKNRLVGRDRRGILYGVEERLIKNGTDVQFVLNKYIVRKKFRR